MQDVVCRRPADAWRPSIGERDSRYEGDSAPVVPAVDHAWGYSSIGQSIRLSSGRLRVRAPLASCTPSDVAQRQRPWSQKPLSVGSNPTVAM